MSPRWAELYDWRRTTTASTNGSPRRVRSAASWRSSARMESAPFPEPGLHPLHVGREVEVGQGHRRPADPQGLLGVALDHPLPASLALQDPELVEQRAVVEDGRSVDALVAGDHQRRTAGAVLLEQGPEH